MRLKIYKTQGLRKVTMLFSAILTFTMGYSQYCTPVMNCGSADLINNFSTTGGVANISNLNSGCSGGYIYYAAQTVSQNPGQNVNISVQSGPSWGQGFRIWVDWNQNGSFADPGEDVWNSGGSGTGVYNGVIAVPVTAIPGTTRMRVMAQYATVPLSGDFCQNFSNFGEVEDYNFQVIPTAPCAGVPNGGTATASVSTVCPGVSFSITSAGVSFGAGTEYQWQSSPDGFTWTNIAGQTGAGFSGTQSAATNYRLRVICTSGPDTAYSNSVLVDLTPFLNCYCTSGATSTFDSNVHGVEFGTINNITGAACGTYSDFTSIQTNLFKGLSYPMTITAGSCGGAYTRYGKVYIDYNHNGLFTDPGEEVFAFGPTTAGQVVQPFNGSVTIPVTAADGLTRMRVIVNETFALTNVNPCGTFTWGETEDYYVNILPPPADEAGVLAITTPGIAACNLGQEIWVQMQNLGTNDLTSATFTVTVNGFNIPTQPWTGLVPAGTSASVQVPVTYVLADGDSVNVTVSDPNGVTENPLFLFNNQTGRRIWAGLSGVKTVYGAGADFVDMDEAIDALLFRGVCDTVYFQIATGNYTSQHVLTQYPGAGPGRLAVFESASGNASDVSFTHSALAAGDNFVFRFNNGDGYMFRNLTARATGTAFSKVIDILGGSSDLTFENNVFVGDTLAPYNMGDFERIVIASTGASNDNRTVIRNNHIMGGNRGLNLGGATGLYETGNVVEGNVIEKYAAIGGIFGNLSGYQVNNNVFRPRTDLTQEAFGVYAVGTIDGAGISANDYLSYRPGSAIFLSNVKGGGNEVLVSNNFIFSGDSGVATLARGVLIQDVNSSDVILANNSIAFYNKNPQSGAITVVDGSQIRFYNNNVGAFGTAPAARIEKSYSVAASNHNNMFGTNLANVLGTVYTSLANFQSATGFDANSVSVNPGFNGTDLHTCAPELNGAAMPMASVAVDFDGDARSATPDIGADEFVGDANGLLAADYFEKCPSVQVTLGGAPLSGVTYSWTPSGNTSEITVTAAGTYVVTATSACGSFSDTAVVVNNPLPTASFTSTTVGLASIFTNTSTNGTSYLWDFGDGNTSTEFSPSHVYTTAGTYSATLTVTNECGSATFGPQPVNVINAGIEENDMASVALFPNPTSGQFTVTLNNISSETVLTVIDVTGKAVLVKNVPAGVNQVTLDATSFASGVYSVKVSSGDFNKVIRLVRK